MDQEEAVDKAVAVHVEGREAVRGAVLPEDLIEQSGRVARKGAAGAALSGGVVAVGIAGPDPGGDLPGHVQPAIGQVLVEAVHRIPVCRVEEKRLEMRRRRRAGVVREVDQEHEAVQRLLAGRLPEGEWRGWPRAGSGHHGAGCLARGIDQAVVEPGLPDRRDAQHSRERREPQIGTLTGRMRRSRWTRLSRGDDAVGTPGRGCSAV